MNSPPALCRRCGLVFPATAFHLGAQTTLAGCQTNCPACGGDADVGDGVYSGMPGGLRLESGPPLTQAMMAALNALRARVESGQITKEQAAKEAEALRPGLGGAFSGWLTQNAIGIAALALGAQQYHESRVSPPMSSVQAERLITLQEQQVDLLRRNLSIAHQQYAKKHPKAPNRKARRAANAKNRRSK